AVVDCARAESARERMLGKLEVGGAASPEEGVVNDLERAELWRLGGGVISRGLERVGVVEEFFLDLPPRPRLGRPPDLVVDHDAIYSTKRNLLARLKGNRALRELFEEICLA